MADRNLYKVIALIAAIFLYLLLAFSLVMIITNSEKIKKDYGFNVEDAIVVEIDSPVPEKPKPVERPEPPQPVQVPQPEAVPTPPTPVVEAKPQPQPEPKPIEEEVQEEVKQESRDIQEKSAKDLFSTVRTDDFTKAMEERQKQEAARASRLEKQKAEEAKKKAEAKSKKDALVAASSEAQKLIQEMQISTPTASQKSGEKHEFWSFVSSKIMAKWQRTISTQDGLSATVVIRIDNQGRVSYSDLSSSNNSLFDTKLKVFLDNLEYDKFPVYKDGPYIEAEFEFTDKEKGL